MNNKIIMNVIENLIEEFEPHELEKIKKAMTIVLFNYDIKEKATEIVEYEGGVPREIQKYIVVKMTEGLSKNTLKIYKLHLTQFADWLGKDIKQATTDDIRVFLIRYQQERNISNSTLDDKRIILNVFFEWMTMEDLIPKNPMKKIKKIKKDSKVREALTQMELEQLRAANLTVRENAVLETLYSTGCRCEELIRLNRLDVDFYSGRIKLFGKGNKERYSFINARAELAIKKYLFTRDDDNEALFVSRKKPNNRIGKRTIETIIKKIGEKGNLKRNIFPHLVRHTTATHMLQNGAALSEVQMLLGHSSPATTQIYAKNNIEDLQIRHRKCIV